MTAPQLLPKTRKDAVHLLQKARRETPLFGTTEMRESACGHALLPARWVAQTTTHLHLITCKVCWAIAHPAKSGMGMF